MGVKVEKALFGKMEVKPEEYDDDKMKGEIKCPYCGVDLSHVKTHIRKYGEIETIVKAYFKIKKEEHISGCKYTTAGAVKVIADVADRDLLSKDEDGRYSLRLHLINEKIVAKKSMLDGSFEKDEKDEIKKASRIYEANKKIDSYLASFKDLIKVRDSIDSNSEIEKHIELKFFNKNFGRFDVIPWNKFYFTDKNLLSAYKYLLNNKVYHPLCFESAVKEIIKPTEKFNRYKIRLEYSDVVKYKDKESRVSIEFIINNDALVKYLNSTVGKKVLIYATFRAREPYKYGKINFLNISGSIYHKNQIYVEK